MQTFVPYPDLRASCVVLDDRRLGKQRVETFQILRALTWPSYAWKNHPAVRMWRGFVPALVEYGTENCREWVRRGYADSVAEQLLAWTGGRVPSGEPMPPWWGLEALHLSHRSALLRKDPGYYRPIFGSEPDDLPYLWPPDVFPRWPVRGQDLPVHEAVRRLGYEEPRPGQAAAAEAAAQGRDVLLVMRPGSGGSTAGLLAGLTTPGRTLWVSPPWGPPAGPVPEVTLPTPRMVEAVGDRPPAIARPPGEQDRAAMQAEGAEPEFVFATPATLGAVERAGLVVVDRAHELSEADAQAVAQVRGDLPLLVVVPRADGAQRAAVAERFGLRSPLWAGGGWDPAATRLETAVVATPAARRRALLDLVRSGRPALVVTATREAADRVSTGLLGGGLRAAVWAPPPMRATRAAESVAAWRSRRLDALVVPAGELPPMRATRAAESVAAWRSRRLDALVVPAGELPPLGRGRLGLLVDASGGTPEAWRDRLVALSPARSALLVEPGAPLADAGCLRSALLQPYGEPVQTPCGRCERCAP